MFVLLLYYDSLPRVKNNMTSETVHDVRVLVGKSSNIQDVLFKGLETEILVWELAYPNLTHWRPSPDRSQLLLRVIPTRGLVVSPLLASSVNREQYRQYLIHECSVELRMQSTHNCLWLSENSVANSQSVTICPQNSISIGKYP